MYATISISMKTKNKKSNKKKIIIIAIFVLAIAAAAGFVVYYSNSNHSNVEPAVKNESKNDNLKTTASPTAKQKKTTTNTDPQAPTTINKTTNKTTMSVITSVDISGDTVYIRGGLNNAVSEGTCYALLKSPSGSSIRKDTTLLPGAASADCKTIRIPVSELSSGTWKYTLNFSSPTAEGVSSENSFQIN